MELKIPDPEQAYWGLRAMKTAAMADVALDASKLQWWIDPADPWDNTSAGGARSHHAGGSGAVSDVTMGI